MPLIFGLQLRYRIRNANHLTILKTNAFVAKPKSQKSQIL